MALSKVERALREAGALVRIKRQARDLSQGKLAKAMRVSQSTVSHIEMGRASAQTTMDALRALGSRVPREVRSALQAAQ